MGEEQPRGNPQVDYRLSPRLPSIRKWTCRRSTCLDSATKLHPMDGMPSPLVRAGSWRIDFVFERWMMGHIYKSEAIADAPSAYASRLHRCRLKAMRG